MFDITAKEKPRRYELRWKLSNALVRLARRVYPQNPEVKAFYMQIMTDQMVYGKAVTRVDPSEIYATPDPPR